MPAHDLARADVTRQRLEQWRGGRRQGGAALTGSSIFGRPIRVEPPAASTIPAIIDVRYKKW